MNIFKSFLNLFRKKDETQEVLEQLSSYAQVNREKLDDLQVDYHHEDYFLPTPEGTQAPKIDTIPPAPKKRRQSKKKKPTSVKTDKKDQA